MRWVQLCGSLSILWHCLSLGLEWKLTFSSQSWNSNTLTTWYEKLIHLKRPWCWERLKVGGGDDRGWDGWMASLTQRTWVWASSGSWWWTGKPGVLQATGSQRVGHDWTELNWTELSVLQPFPLIFEEGKLQKFFPNREKKISGEDILLEFFDYKKHLKTSIINTNAEAEASIVCPPDVKSQLIRKDPNAGKDWGQEGKGATRDKMVG